MRKIGLYICECGPNVKEAIDIAALADFAAGLKDVAFIRTFSTLCSTEGVALIEREIKEHHLTHIVIAACSPREHEITFRKALLKAGINPYLLQIANIREQCAWVIKDKACATDKAKAIINAAIKRVVHHEPLEAKEIAVQTDVLVVGAGVAGISAALTLAQKARTVHLIERAPVIGGKTALYEKVFPGMECASCMLAPKLDEVLHHDRIKIYTLSEVEKVQGFYGNFTVTVRKKARYVDSIKSISCRACIDSCPVSVRNEFNEGLDERKAIFIPYDGALPNVAVIDHKHCLHFTEEKCDLCSKACPLDAIKYDDSDEILELTAGAVIIATGFDIFNPEAVAGLGYGKIDNVYTSLQCERLLNTNGPTGGRVILKNGQPPKAVGVIHCVGSRTKKYREYCSGICCAQSLKVSHLIKQQVPDVSITHFCSDLCFPGKQYHEFYSKLTEGGELRFIRVEDLESISIKEFQGDIFINYADEFKGHRNIAVDMVMLAVAVEPPTDVQTTARLFDLACDKDGFLIEDDVYLSPVSTAREGVKIAGCVKGPKDIGSSVAEGQAAAGVILSRLVPGESITLDPAVCTVEQEGCSGCRICIATCPYGAIVQEVPTGGASINEVLCKGCGICAAVCPAGAIRSKHFDDAQLSAEIRGLLE